MAVKCIIFHSVRPFQAVCLCVSLCQNRLLYTLCILSGCCIQKCISIWIQIQLCYNQHFHGFYFNFFQFSFRSSFHLRNKKRRRKISSFYVHSTRNPSVFCACRQIYNHTFWLETSIYYHRIARACSAPHLMINDKTDAQFHTEHAHFPHKYWFYVICLRKSIILPN